MLFLIAIAFFGITSIPKDLPPQALSVSNPLNTMLMGLLLAASLSMLAVSWQKAWPLLLRSPLLIAFLVLAAVSVYWSAYSGVSIRRVGTLFIPVLCALALIARHDMQEIVIRFGRIVLILAAISAFLAIVVPRIGVMHALYHSEGDPDLTGAWRGITGHKNTLGYVVSIAAEIYAWRLFSEPRRKPLHLLIVILLMIMCFKTRSATALVASVLGVGLLFVLSVRRRFGMPGVALEAMMATAAIAAVVAFPFFTIVVTSLLGKDLTFTGRVPLWQALMYYIERRPWFGYGYGGFWIDGSPQILRLDQIIPWEPPNAHNAYLELLLTVGVVGAVLGTAFLLSVIIRAYSLSRNGGPHWAGFAAIFSIVFFLTNMVDTMLLRSGDIYCFLLVLCHFALAKQRISQESGRPEPVRLRRRFLPLDPPMHPGPSDEPAVNGAAPVRGEILMGR
ncbi:MAG TPA: O-antigen ligase [Dongiaceae bacterium]